MSNVSTCDDEANWNDTENWLQHILYFDSRCAMSFLLVDYIVMDINYQKVTIGN